MSEFSGAWLTISKRAENPDGFKRAMIPYANARSAFRAFLEASAFQPADVVLLPAFVGWSPREGSGIFDPVQASGVQFDFYRMTSRLEIDLEDLRFKCRSRQARVVVLVHYFGFPDRSYGEAVELAQAAGAQVVEDEAHALFSDLVGGICGRRGDAAIFSLHKMLPPTSGGMLVLNRGAADAMAFSRAGSDAETERALVEYDFFEISRARRRNALYLLHLLEPLAGRVEPLYATLPNGVVPQTLPVLVHSTNRDQLYFDLNARGWGVVTLYHTLVKPISEHEYPDSHWLARHILNLPVHQEIEPGALDAMVKVIEELT